MTPGAGRGGERLYVALLHFPVYDKNGRVVTTCVTILDLHDLARVARTYGLAGFLVVHPVASQRALVRRIVEHWRRGFGAGYNPTRRDAFETLSLHAGLDQAVEAVRAREGGAAPRLVVTTVAGYRPPWGSANSPGGSGRGIGRTSWCSARGGAWPPRWWSGPTTCSPRCGERERTITCRYGARPPWWWTASWPRIGPGPRPGGKEQEMPSLVDALEKRALRDDLPEIQAGNTVRVHLRVVEGKKERIQVFEGMVLGVGGRGNRRSLRVRKVSNGVGVERTFPLESPMVARIEVVQRGRVRRAKLYYMRERSGKSARLQEISREAQAKIDRRRGEA